jgi:hypothetical protein
MPRVPPSPRDCDRALVVTDATLYPDEDRESAFQLLDHLVDRGFDVDVAAVADHGGDAEVMIQFGDRVRAFRDPMPDLVGTEGTGAVVPALLAAIGYATRIATSADLVPGGVRDWTVLQPGDTEALDALDSAMGWRSEVASRRLHPAHGLRAPSPSPLPDAARLRAHAEALRRHGGIAAAIDAARRALQLAPSDPESLALYLDLVGGREDPDVATFRQWRPARIALDPGETRRFPGGAPTAGFGWAWPEHWGCWTMARQARIVLAGPAVDRPLLARLKLHATDDGTGEDQTVDTFIDGRAAGVLSVPRDDEAREYALPIAANAFAASGALSIDLWIHRPAVKREGDRIVDPRRLGVALSTIGLSEVPARRTGPKRGY